jgi:hypothetical protein
VHQCRVKKFCTVDRQYWTCAMSPLWRLLGWPPDWTLLPSTPRHAKKRLPSRYLIDSPTHLSPFSFSSNLKIFKQDYTVYQKALHYAIVAVPLSVEISFSAYILERSSLNMTDRVPRPYKTTGEIIFLCHTYHKNTEMLLLISGLYYMASRC